MKRALSLIMILSAFSLLSAQRLLPGTRFLQAEESAAPDQPESGDEGADTGSGGGSAESPDSSAPEQGSGEDESAPESPEGGDGEYVGGEEGSTIVSNMNLQGDQFIKLGVAVEFPLNFYSDEYRRNQLHIGGSGWIGYNYFLNEYLAFGFDIGFGFHVSIGSNVFNFVPFMASITYQPVIWRFEFPLTLEAGFAWHSHTGRNYFPALALKAEVGAMYRITDSWSAGINASYFVSPEFKWGNEGATTRWGQFLTVGASARYHF